MRVRRAQARLCRPVIPAKGRIQMAATKLAAGNQARIAINKSRLLTPPVIPAKGGIQMAATRLATGNQARIATGNPLSLDGLAGHVCWLADCA